METHRSILKEIVKKAVADNLTFNITDVITEERNAWVSLAQQQSIPQKREKKTRKKFRARATEWSSMYKCDR